MKIKGNSVTTIYIDEMAKISKKDMDKIWKRLEERIKTLNRAGDIHYVPHPNEKIFIPPNKKPKLEVFILS